VGVLEVDADGVEVITELAEVALEPVEMAQDFLGPLLNLEPTQAEDDCLQVSVETVG